MTFYYYCKLNYKDEDLFVFELVIYVSTITKGPGRNYNIEIKPAYLLIYIIFIFNCSQPIHFMIADTYAFYLIKKNNFHQI
jgi:hypothetical protein